GTLAFGGGLQAYGTPGTTTFRADPGSELDFGGPPCTFDSSTSVTAATVLFDGTTAAVAGSYHAASTTLYNSQVTFSGTVYLDGSSDVEVNDLSLNRPLVNTGQAMMFGHIHLGAGASLTNAAGASLTLEIGTVDGAGSVVNQGTLVKATSPYGPGTVS